MVVAFSGVYLLQNPRSVDPRGISQSPSPPKAPNPQAGVSAGILGTGAASGWVTLGIGVIVGLVIDQIVSAIWSRWSDPSKNIEEELNYQLKVMQRVICYGDEKTKGLVQQSARLLAKHGDEAICALAIASMTYLAFKQWIRRAR